MATNDSILSIAQSIQAYLAVMPHAADTLEGIHNSWINWPGLHESFYVTEAALEYLERIGVVERITVGNREIWRRKQK
jgi:hypothetical protein